MSIFVFSKYSKYFEPVNLFIIALPRRSEEGFGHLEPVSTY